MAIDALIDKRDTLEIVRDAIAQILLVGFAEQQSLAVAAGKDPAPWAVRVFADRSRPWPQFLDYPAQAAAQPVVNISVDESTTLGSASDTVRSQARECTFLIDCYGYGLTQADGAGGHIAGDRLAALEGQRAARLVRNLLMAGGRTSLGLSGLVWRRMVRSIEAFDPSLDNARAGQNVLGVRLMFEVLIGEHSPQVTPVGVDSIGLSINDATGEIALCEWAGTPWVAPATPWVDPVVQSLSIGTLIDAPDMFEVVRAQVVNILATEAASQAALAVDAGRDPEPWAMRVFEERANPWSAFIDAGNDALPIVNVQLATCSLVANASDVVARQVYTGRYTVDVYASGQSAADGAGHVVGDQLAARRAQRTARLVRNVLMAAIYTELDLAPRVGARMVESATAYRSEPGPLQNVAVVRLSLDVRFAEFAPQVQPVAITGIRLELLRADNGEVIAALNWSGDSMGTFPVRFPQPSMGAFPITLAADA